MPVQGEFFQNPGGDSAFYSHQILHSCRFNAADSSRLYRTFGTPSSTTAFTVSFWIKIPSIAGYQQIFSRGGGFAGGGASFALEDNYNHPPAYPNVLYLYGMAGSSGGNNGAGNISSQQFVDPTGWFHIHYKLDTSKSGMSGNNAKVVLHVNGVNITFDVTTNEPSGNWTRFNTDGDVHHVGNGGSGTQGDQYLAEFIFLDGQYEDYTSFGSFKNGVWTPDDPSGLDFSGNNSFHLKFEDASDLGNDSSGNNNDFTATGLGADHQVIDSPTNNVGSG